MNEEQRQKLSEFRKEYYRTHDPPFKGRRHSEESKQRMSEAHKQTYQMGRIGWNKGKHLSEEHKQNIRAARMGHGVSEESRRKISATSQGVTLDEWTDYVSYLPYCPKFDFKLKEKIRNRDNRSCQLCGKSEIHNGERLTVHHIDGNKMQGCDSHWHLVALCRSCNSTEDTIEKEFLIVANTTMPRRDTPPKAL